MTDNGQTEQLDLQKHSGENGAPKYQASRLAPSTKIMCGNLLLCIQGQVTPVLDKPVQGQLVCYLVSDSDAKNVHLIYVAHLMDENLWKRYGTLDPLPSCSDVSAPGLDSCLVCLEETKVFAKCLLTDPSAHLRFEADGNINYLNNTRILCGFPTTTAPTTSAPATASTPSPSAGGAQAGWIIGVILLLLVAVSAVVVFYIWKQKKKMSWRNCCSHAAVPTSDDQNGTTLTPGESEANGHIQTIQTSPC